MLRIYGISTRNRPAAIALGALALGVGAIFLAFGIVLLLGLAAVGTLVGAGVVLYRAVTGRRVDRLRPPPTELDPSLEVFPAERPPHKLEG
jgi:hypothetical protein